MSIACPTVRSRPFSICIAAALLFTELAAAPARALSGVAWKSHIVDGEGRGADGTKLADINGDGRPDIVTGWEEDGSTRVYLNPGPRAAKTPWPKVVVGRTPSAEDAVFADLDGDGHVDVVSATEGKSQQILVHWAPAREKVLDAFAWHQGAVPAVAGVTRWMFAEPGQIDARHGLDLVIGGKRVGDAPSFLGWLEAPAQPRELAAWKWHPLREMGWTMTLHLEDMDGDGDGDILFSDRTERDRGIYWLEHPGTARVASATAWAQHIVGATASSVHQVMLIGAGDIDGDGLRDIVAPVALDRVEARDPNRHSEIRWYRRTYASGRHWTEHRIAVPENTGNVKHAAIGDIDGDGRADLVVSCEHSAGARVGVYWLRGDNLRAPSWQAFDIAGAPGVKFDLVRLLDLDADGDLDVLTNEEQESGRGLGVVWYENPHRSPVASAR